MPDQDSIATDGGADAGTSAGSADTRRDGAVDHRRLLTAALPFLASDRVQDLLGVHPLARGGWGAALFADLSGFTALSRRLVEEFGPRRGAERATHTLNTILERIIAPVHDWGGSVLAFSGDGFLCWFPVPPLDAEESQAAVDVALAAGVRAAVGCALHMQHALQEPGTGDEVADDAVQASPALGLKVGVAGGYAWRFVVGEPSIQLLDAIAGAPVAQAVDAQNYAQPGEIWVARAVVGLLPEFAHPLGLQAGGELTSTDAESVDGGKADPAAVQIGGIGPLPTPPGGVVPVSELHAAAIAALAPEQIQPWLPQFVWARLQAGQSRFLAELRPAVAVFARFAETQMGDTPASQSQLAAYVGWVQQVFQRAGGTVIQLTLGDKGSYIYGVLGAPVQHDDGALRAARVARQLAQGPADGEFRPQAQVGVAQGRMRAGEYGSATRRTYGVQGSAVNLAARLMMLAPPGTVFADPAVATLMETHFELTPLPPEQLRGFVAPVRVYRLADAQPRVTAQEPFAHMNLVRRSELLAQLLERWQLAEPGALVACHLVGEAGSGKSALLWQFAQICPTEAVSINCRVASTGSAYGLLVALLRQLLDIRADMQSDAAWSALSAALGTGADAESGVLSRAATETTGDWHGDVPLAVLSETLGRSALESAVGLNVEQRRALLANLLDRAWRRAAAQGRRVILLDDFQAADPESQAVVAQLFHRDVRGGTQAHGELGAHGRMLVTAQRELAASLTDSAPSAGSVLPLTGLSELESRALLQQRLHGPLDALASDLLLRYSQGNPLYLTVLAEELVNQGTLRQSDWGEGAGEPAAEQTWQVAEEIFGRLQTARCLQRRDGLWRLREDAVLGPADLGLPDSLHRLVLTRLDRLPVSAGLTLRVLAAADAGLDEMRLAAAHPDADTARLQTDLNTLAVHGFVRAVGSPGALAYAITNSVVQDVVYESMLDRQRRELHSALAHAYQMTAAEPTLADVVEPVAYHLFRGQLEGEEARRQAGRALEQAVATARTRYALETALGYVDCLLTLAPNWQIYSTRFDILHALGLRREQQELLDTLARLEDAPGNEVALCHARYHEAISDFDAAHQWATRALEIAQSGRDAAGQVEAFCLLGQVARRRGDFAAAAAGYRAALAVPLATLDPQRQGEIAYGLGIAARHQGNFEEAHQRLQAALDTFHACGSRADEALALTALGVLAQMERRYDAAYTLHSQALELRQSINDWPGEGSSLVSLAQLRRAQGYHAEAVQLLHGARRIHRALHDRWWENRILNEIGVIYLIAGMLPAAQRALEEGIGLAQAIGDVAGEMVLLLNLGQVLRDSGQLDAARSMLSRSLEMARTRNEVYIQAQCFSDLARTHLLAGVAAQALADADQALELLRTLGLDTAITADLATQAEAYLCQGQVAAAHACAQRIVATLDAADGEGADFPQRDYWVAGRVFHASQDAALAVDALEKSRRHLAMMAERFQDTEMREAFLTSRAVNRAITAGVWTLDA